MLLFERVFNGSIYSHVSIELDVIIEKFRCYFTDCTDKLYPTHSRGMCADPH